MTRIRTKTKKRISSPHPRLSMTQPMSSRKVYPLAGTAGNKHVKVIPGMAKKLEEGDIEDIKYVDLNISLAIQQARQSKALT